MKEEFEKKVAEIKEKMEQELGESKLEENKVLKEKINDLITQWEAKENEFKNQMKDFEGIFSKNDGKIFQRLEEIKKKSMEQGLIKVQLDNLLKQETDAKLKLVIGDRKKIEYETTLEATSENIQKFSKDTSGVIFLNVYGIRELLRGAADV